MLRDKGDIKTGIKGKSASWGYVDQEDARQKTSRLSDTIWDDPSANRITAYLELWYKGLVLDKTDELSIIADPKASYTQVTLASLRRKIDEKIITALRGNKYTGENGTSASALPSAQKIAASSAGLTMAKLISVQEKLSAKGDGTMDAQEEVYMVIDAAGRSDLLQISQVTSADYNTVKTLVEGQVVKFMGINFIVVDTDLIPTSGSTKYYIGWKKSGLGIAFGEDLKTRVEEIQDKNYSWSTYAEMYVGATRVQDEKVVEVACV